MKQEKSVQLAHHLHHLEEMLELANDPKLLWEEMQILGKKAFTLQEKMEQELNELEEEIKEVLNTVRIEQQIAAKEGEKKDDIPEKSSFFAKPKIPHEGSEMVSHETNENGPTAAMTVDRDKETSEKFARLLGAF